MVDKEGKRVVVSTDGDAGPYVVSDPETIERVAKELAERGVPRSLRKGAVTTNPGSVGNPSTGDGVESVADVVDLGKDADAEAIQEILDSID